MNGRCRIVILRPRAEAPSLNMPLAPRWILWLLPRDAGLSGPMQTLELVNTAARCESQSRPVAGLSYARRHRRPPVAPAPQTTKPADVQVPPLRAALNCGSKVRPR